MADKVIMFGFWTAFSLCSSPVLAQSVAPDCIYDANASSSVLNPDVNRWVWNLNHSGEWYEDTVTNRGELLYNSVLYMGAVTNAMGSPIEMQLHLPSAEVHFDVDVGAAGFGAASGAGSFSGFCNLSVASSNTLSGRGQLTFDTLDADLIFQQNLSILSDPPLTPRSNSAREYRLTTLSLDKTDLILDGIGLKFFDARQAGQGSEAVITLNDASIDASGARYFGTIASAGNPVPLRFKSIGNANTENSLRLGLGGDSFLSAGPTYVDIEDGTTFVIRDTGTLTQRAFEFPGRIHVDAGFFSTPWEFNIGQDGNGGTFKISDSYLNFNNGWVHLHDDASYEIAPGGSNVHQTRIVVNGQNANHKIGLNSQSYVDYIDVSADGFTLEYLGGALHTNTISVDQDVDDFSLTGNRGTGLASTPFVLGVSGSTNVSDPQTVLFQGIDRTLAFHLPLMMGNTELVFDHASVGIETPPTLAGTNNRFVLRPGSNVTLEGGTTLISGASRLGIHVEDATAGANPDHATLYLSGAGHDLGKQYDFSVVNDMPFAIAFEDFSTTSYIPIASSGNVTLPGDNTVLQVGLFGNILPGDSCNSTACRLAPTPQFGTLSVGGAVMMNYLTRLTFDVGFDGPVQANDKVLYGVGAGTGNSDISLAKIIVRPLGFNTASDVDGLSFVLIDHIAGTSGSLNTHSDQWIEAYQLAPDVSMPAAVELNVLEDPRLTGRLVVGTTANISTMLQKATGNRNHRELIAGLISQPQTTLLSSGATIGQTLNVITNAQLTNLSRLHAEPFSSYLTVGTEQMELVFDLVNEHAQYRPSRRSLHPENAVSTETWSEVGYAVGNVRGNDGLGSYGYNLSGFVFGRDFSNNLGAYLGYGSSALSEHDLVDQKLNSNHFHLGIYTNNMTAYDWDVTATGGFAYSKVTSERLAPTQGLLIGGTAEAKFNTYGIYFGFEAKREFVLESGMVITPSLTTKYSWLHHSEFVETGANDLDYSVASSSNDALPISFELNAETPTDNFLISGFARYTFDAFAQMKSEHEIFVSNAAFGEVAQVGQNRGPHSFALGASINGALSDYIVYDFSVDEEWSTNGARSTLEASLTATW